MKTFDPRIEWRDPASLTPYSNNAKTHPTEQVDKIAASIASFGFDQPIVVDGDGVIIKGHGRREASLRLELDQVPVLVRTDLSVAEIKAARLADNRTAQSPWDDELLRVELEALLEEDFDLGLTGFDLAEIDELLAAVEPEQTGLTEDDEVPEAPEQPVTRPGDLWVLGSHRLLCGDATVLADVERVLGGQLADMAWTDPPYNVDYASSPKDKLRGKHRPILNDNLGAGFEAFLHDACTNILQVTKGAVYICMSSSELDTLQKAFRRAGGKWSTFIIWAKNTFTLGRADYQRQYEPILYGWRDGSDHYWCGARDQGDVWFFDKPARNDLHPTMKPVALVQRAIRNSSKSRDIVLDPFGGSGSTLIACEKAGRQARLVELDPTYVDTIIDRWQRFTGGRARHAESGEPFPRSAVEAHAAHREVGGEGSADRDQADAA
jgi:DNA modification methylase